MRRFLRLILFLFPAFAHSQLKLSFAPRDGAVIPRNITTNFADARIAGSVTQTQYASLRIKCFQNGKNIYNQATSLNFIGGVADFDKIIKIKAGKYRYDFEIELYGNDTIRKKIIDVVAGDIYIIQGQSNAVANMYYGSSNAYKDSFIRSFGSSSYDFNQSISDTTWHIANGDGYYNSGCIGQWGLVLSKILLDSFDIPIAIMNGAVGGTSVTYHQRYNPQPDNAYTCYGRLLTRMKKAGLDKKVRGILWFQGESDGQKPQLHDSLFRILYTDWAKDYKGMQKNYIVQVRGGGCGSPTVEMLEIQRQFEFDLSKLKVISSNGLNGHDGCHYYFQNGYQQLGIELAALMARDLYGSNRIDNIDPPNILKAEFSNGNRDEITLFMRENDDMLYADPGFEALFSISGDPNIFIKSGSLKNNKVVLKLNTGSCSTLFVSYMGRAMTQPWVKNKTGCGLIGFNKIPVFKPDMKTIYSGCTNTTVFVGADSVVGCSYSWIRMRDGKKQYYAGFYEILSGNESYKCIRKWGNSGCSNDTFIVNLFTDKTPPPSLGNDTILCNGDSAVFSLVNGNIYKEISWTSSLNSGKGPGFKTADAGFVKVRTMSTLGCFASDSLFVKTSDPKIKLSPGIYLCKNQDTLIAAQSGFTAYSWNGIHQTQNQFLAGAGPLKLIVTDSLGCKAEDSLYIYQYPDISFSDQKFSICSYDSAKIQLPDACQSWKLNGANFPVVSFVKPNNYWVEYYDSNGCKSTGKIEINSKPVPIFSLGNDTGICDGGNLQFKCDFIAQVYQWNGVLYSSDKFTISKPGSVICRVRNYEGCEFSDTVNILKYPAPFFQLPYDTTICRGSLWQPTLPAIYKYELNGNRVDVPTISVEGIYTISAINSYGCEIQKITRVSVKNCINQQSEFGSNSLLFYPNPVTNQIHVKQSGDYRIYNAEGALIIQVRIGRDQPIDLSELSPGVYTLMHQNLRQKLIKI